MELKPKIRLINGFPAQGIVFRDITPLLSDANALDKAIYQMLLQYDEIDKVAGIESRGFIIGGALAYELHAGFIPIRKAGKLPFKTESITYSTEYSEDTLEIHTDAIKESERVLIVDDLLATGGTAKAAIELVERLGGIVVGCCFLVELLELEGREKLEGVEVFSLIRSGPSARVKW